jgi:hypothetical protein
MVDVIKKMIKIENTNQTDITKLVSERKKQDMMAYKGSSSN